MKKILTTIIFILLCIMLYFTCFKGISLGNIHISSVTEIKQKSIELDEKKEQAIEKTNKEYPSELNNLKESISSLNIAKDKYNEKIKYLENEVDVNSVQINKYKIEYLWTKLGDYADNRKVKMKMDVIDAGNGTYNLSFNIVGSYINVTDFIYDIEKDTNLNFRIADFKMIPDSSTTTTTDTTADGTTTDREDPYSEIIVITKTNGGSSTTSKNEENASSTTSNTTTKTSYGPNRLEATFKVYGLEISFN